MINKESASDSTYHARHSARSLNRAKRMADNIDAATTLLDVGCNNGITSQYLLDVGKAEKVTGIELHASTVADSLLENPQFSLIEGDIAKLELEGNFDVCIYGAVHHHILNFNGLGVAVETFQKLATHCNRTLFFETGQISEGGRWDWQRAIRRYFRTDEEHFCYLLSSIAHLVDDFSVIGKFWIHGIRRTFFRIDLKPVAERSMVKIPAGTTTTPTASDTQLVRSCGSQNQRLVPASDSSEKDSPCAFWITENPGESKLFVKQHRHRPFAALTEWQIGQAIANAWAVRPIATTGLPGSLVFPYQENAKGIRAYSDAVYSTRRDIAEQLLKIFSDARQVRPNLPTGFLLAADQSKSLLDLCDLNPNNFLVLDSDGATIVRVVDFEQQSTDYVYRNRLHLASMLTMLGQFRLRALREYVFGVAGGVVHLITAQTKPIDVRIRLRQPSIFSLSVAEIRSRMGALTRMVLDAIGYG